MNAHERRKESRRLHMELPLGKRVRLSPILGRSVYAYGIMSCTTTITKEVFANIEYATVSRHVRCGHGGLVDLMLFSLDGKKQCISTSARGIRLINRSDRAPRPWWNELRRSRKSKGATSCP